MFKGFEYNKSYKRIKSKTIYAKEIELLCEFALSDNENIRLEYDTANEAKNATQSFRTYIEQARKPLKIMQRDNYVFAIKTNESDAECR